ncbi:MAG: DUF393 domain-containing protein [Pseudomonadota bacterium]
MSDETHTEGQVKVLYDGACPLCSREIALYQGLEAACPVEYSDISRDDTPLPGGLDRETVLARFHVQKESGEIVSGARAFVALWERLPGWRWLAKVAAIPGVTPLLELAYRAFLPVRPLLQRLVRSPG